MLPMDLFAKAPYVISVNKEETPTQRNLPPKTKIKQWASEMGAIYKDGFQWSDIGAMLKDCSEYFEEYPDLSISEKKAVIVDVMNTMVDENKISALPSPYFDPLFKKIVPPFADLVLSNQIALPPLLIPGKPTSEIIERRVKSIIDSFKDGFDWEDLALVVRFAMQFTLQYKDLVPKERAEIAKGIVNGVIDETEIPYLPDHFFHSVFKDIADPLIDRAFELPES